MLVRALALVVVIIEGIVLLAAAGTPKPKPDEFTSYANYQSSFGRKKPSRIK